MKRLLFTLMAIIFAIQGWTQTLNEGFEGTTFPPEDWTKVTTQGTVSWNRYTSSSPRGTACASVNYQSPNHTNYLITPKLSVTTGLDTISFWIKCPTQYSGTTFSIMVSTTDNAVSSFGATSLYSLVSASSGGGITTTWIKHSVALTDYIGQNIYIAFKVVDADGLRVMLDDVTGPNLFVPSCLKPSILSYSNIGALSADVSWTETGTASQWTIEYKPSSDTSWVNAISNTASSTTFNLTNLTGNTSYNVRVKAVCISGTDESDWRIGSFTTPYSCPQPTSLAVPSANITTTDALVSWSPTINPVNWNEGYLLQYKPSSVTDWNLATSVTAIQDTFYLIQGLNPSTGYSIRLKSVCNPGVDSSSWTNTVNFTTLCVPINTFPWAESFEGLTAANTLPNNCWTATNLGLKTGTQNTNFNSYNRNSHTGTGAAFFVWGCNDSFKTPSFQFAANTSYDFSFWYVTDGLSGWNTLRAELWDATTNTLVDTLGSQVNNPINSTYSLYTSSFTVPNENDSYYVSIYCQSTSNPWYLTIDDISVEPSPTCPSAYNLTSTLHSSTSVDLNWMQNGNGSGWIIAYGDTTAFDPSTAAHTITISSTDPVPYTLAGLTPQTPYSFAIRQACNGGAWSNIVSLTTPSNAATLPYSHSFEDVAENNAWSFINGTQTNQWVIGTAADTLGTNGLYVSNDQGVTNAYTVGTSRVYAYRDFEVPVGAGELELSFDWRAQGGVAHNDFLRMYLIPLDANITAGVIPPNGLDQSAQIGNYTGGTGEHWLSQSTVWQHKTMRINSLQFPNLAGRTWRLLVHWRNESNTTTGIQPPAAVDNINLSVVTCPTPTTLVATNPTTTSTDLAWQETGQATNWIIEYKENSSSTWLQASANSNPFTLTGLNNSSNYQARVRSLCSASDTSLSSQTISFNTACDLITSFPWSEGFESTWIASQLPGNALAPNCWTNVNKGTGTSNLWTRTTSYHHAGTSSAQMYTDNSSQNNDWLITPQMSLTGNERLRFWAMNYSSTTSEVDEISIWISNPDLIIDTTNMGLYDSITGFTQIYQTGIPIGDWQQYEVNLSQYSGNRYIAFVRKHTPDNGWYLRLDDVLIEPIPSCARPTNVVSVNNTQNDIEIGWTNGNTTDASWYVYYRPIGTTNYDSVLANSNPYTLTGLTSSTIYDIYVRTNCSTDLSEASPTVNLATACGTISSFPWSEGFESDWTVAVAPGNKSAPNCWKVIDRGGVNGTYEYWWKNSSNVGYPGTSHSGSRHAACYTDYGSTSHNDWLITPQITLLGTERLRFWAMRANSSSTEPDEISVYISDVDAVLDTTGMGQNGNMPNFTQIFNQILPVGDWQQYEVNLSQYSGNRYIAFVRQNTPDGYYLRLDDVLIDELPSCVRPTNVTTSNFTPNSVDLTWVNGNQTDASWYVYFKQNSSSVWDSIQVSSNPFTLPNLTAATSYNVYIKTDCSTDLSEASNTITFQTSCDALTFPTVNEEFNTFLPSICWERKTGLLPATGTATLSPTTSGWNNNTNPIQTSSGNHPYINIWSTSTQYWLITPTYNLGDGSTATQLEFDAILSNYDATGAPSTSGIDDKFAVVISTDNGGTWDVANAFIWSNATGATRVYNSLYPLQRVIVPLINPATQLPYSGLIRIGFYGESTQSNADNYLHIDNVLINLLPACSRPTAVATTNGVGTSVDVTFTPGNTTDNSWYVYYKPTTSTNWDSINVTSIPATLPNLNLQTTYQIYVKTDCGNGTNSSASNIITYTTPCYTSAISSFPWTESFENGISCWTINSSITAADWTSETSGYSPTATPHVGSNMIMFNSNNLNSGEWSTIYSPVLNFPNDQYQVSFWMFRDNNDYLTTADRVELYINSTASATGATLLGTINRSYSLAPVETLGGWHQYSFTLPAGTIGNQYVILKGISEYGRNIYVDDVTVDVSGVTPCPDPTSVLVQNITSTTADVSWIAGGTETSWEVRLGTTGVPVTVTSPTYHFPSLSTGTTYTVYVRANCGTGYSAWVSSTPFTTPSVLTVVTLPQTSVTQTSAILHGTVTPGAAPILSQGFEWKATSATTWTVESAAGTTITHTLTTLIANTSYTYRAFAMTSTDTVRGVDISFTTLPIVPPTVVTSPVTNIQATTATFNGTVAQGTDPINGRGFEYKLTSTSTWTGALDITATGTTAITASPTGLTANTQYDVRAYVIIGTTKTYGNVVNFITLQNTVTPPTVVTSPVSNLTQTSVTLNGTVTQGAESITSQGFEWKEASQTTWIRVPIIGTLTYNLPGLTANTAYQCRAYAQTPSASYTYGATVNFTTLPIVPPTVVTSPVSNLAPTSVTLNGTVTQGTNPILTKGFEWRPINTTTWIRVPVTGTLTYNLPGLTASTTYEYRAYATTAIDTTNGLVVNFTTLPMPVVLGDVRTLEATDSAAHSATLNGILVNVGNALSNIKVGFVYSTMSNPMIGGTNVITDTVPYIVGMTSFNKSIVGLQSNTSYFFKAYVTNSAGTKYGEEKTFITLGLENPQAESFSVSMYPNPATNTTKLVVSGVVGEANIVISDVQGRIINTINAKSVNGVVEQTIDVNNLAKGVYYVRIQNSTTSRTQKLIVQ